MQVRGVSINWPSGLVSSDLSLFKYIISSSRSTLSPSSRDRNQLSTQCLDFALELPLQLASTELDDSCKLGGFSVKEYPTN